MKRAKATEADKKLIKKWLLCKNPVSTCPFKSITDCDYFLTYCKRFFPQKADPFCPCAVYPINYVRRVARELIK